MQKTPGTGTTKDAAVSEVMGVVLLTGIVIIMLSVLGTSIFSMDGPDDVPHTKIQAWMDSSENKIYLKHSGGEFLNAKDCEILLNFRGEKYAYPSEMIFEGLGNENIWRLGEVLTIDARNIWGMDIKNNDDVELFLIDVPSKQPIQVARLTPNYETEPLLKIWITPNGNVIDTSGSGSKKDLKGYGSPPQVRFVDSKTKDDVADKVENKDRNCTTYYPPNEDELNASIYQEFDFDIVPPDYGLTPGDSLSNVTLKIVYYTHDNSVKKMKVKFYTEKLGWLYNNKECPKYPSVFGTELFNLTGYVNSTEDLANLKIRIEAVAQADASAEKEIFIDYMALWIE